MVICWLIFVFVTSLERLEFGFDHLRFYVLMRALRETEKKPVVL